METVLIQTVTLNKAKFLTFGFFSNPPRKTTTYWCNPHLHVPLSLFPSPEKRITERLPKWPPYSVTPGHSWERSLWAQFLSRTVLGFFLWISRFPDPILQGPFQQVVFLSTPTSIHKTLRNSSPFSWQKYGWVNLMVTSTTKTLTHFVTISRIHEIQRLGR